MLASHLRIEARIEVAEPPQDDGPPMAHFMSENLQFSPFLGGPSVHCRDLKGTYFNLLTTPLWSIACFSLLYLCLQNFLARALHFSLSEELLSQGLAATLRPDELAEADDQRIWAAVLSMAGAVHACFGIVGSSDSSFSVSTSFLASVSERLSL